MSQIVSCIKLERVALLLPLHQGQSNTAVTLAEILEFFREKKADFEYFAVPATNSEEKTFELLCILKQTMELGQIMLVNLDASMQKREFNLDDNFPDIIPLGILNRKTESLFKLFSEFGLEPPEYIH